jgi:lysophospholipase L1-like esterase
VQVIDDLWGLANPQLDKIQQPDNPHFTSKGSAVLAREIAQAIDAALKSHRIKNGEGR